MTTEGAAPTRILFRDLLRLRNIDPATVLVMRHRPSEPPLRAIFHRIAIQQPDLFNMYQCFQNERAEKQLERAAYLASFVGPESGEALFMGLYRKVGATARTLDEYWSLPENKQLRELGMIGWVNDGSRKTALKFDLELLDLFLDWKGRLAIEWQGGERSWSRWAHDNEFAVISIGDKDQVEPEMPKWNEIVWAWSDLRVGWRTWRAHLSTMRGIYFIFDASDGKCYVGSACGDENLLQRWTNYADTGHGGNALLRQRDPTNFRFSILELVGPAASPTEVRDLEQNWKRRLSTFAPDGLNEN